jgi:hypothetical protein
MGLSPQSSAPADNAIIGCLPYEKYGKNHGKHYEIMQNIMIGFPNSKKFKVAKMPQEAM